MQYLYLFPCRDALAVERNESERPAHPHRSTRPALVPHCTALPKIERPCRWSLAAWRDPGGAAFPRPNQGREGGQQVRGKKKTARQVTNHAPYSTPNFSPDRRARRAPAPPRPDAETQRITRPTRDPHPCYGPAPRSSCCPAARRLPTRREPRSSDLMPRRGSCTGRPQPRACRPRPSAPGSAAAPAPSSRSAWVRTRWQVRKK